MNSILTFTSIILFSVLLFFSSCEIIKNVDEAVSSEKDTSTYIIKQGMHSSTSKGRGANKITGQTMRFEVTFDSSAVYKTSTKENQADINKLFGTSDCGSEHHMNSARFGWRWYKEQLEIHAYTYVNGKRSSKFISVVQIGKPYVYEVQFEKNRYNFILDDQKVTMPRSCSGDVEGYMLYPYFGGDEQAPHDIKIILNTL
ncbi:MAG: hypothetical protein LPJ89_03645 [Hymenobacteraceae bacterium]|nr:hypothetical protein [Hymenobacteraceae bacterium]MDX5397187.1 hypothetical protein [Hymenobacteraceae bacterium]MDX5442857.1 hypothetical protein [Hymenobacteraceae bacterium]MDX5513263.1 hypothetical protein [Hymenobacteraceae bacterium]